MTLSRKPTFVTVSCCSYCRWVSVGSAYCFVSGSMLYFSLSAPLQNFPQTCFRSFTVCLDTWPSLCWFLVLLDLCFEFMSPPKNLNFLSKLGSCPRKISVPRFLHDDLCRRSDIHVQPVSQLFFGYLATTLPDDFPEICFRSFTICLDTWHSPCWLLVLLDLSFEFMSQIGELPCKIFVPKFLHDDLCPRSDTHVRPVVQPFFYFFARTLAGDFVPPFFSAICQLLPYCKWYLKPGSYP